MLQTVKDILHFLKMLRKKWFRVLVMIGGLGLTLYSAWIAKGQLDQKKKYERRKALRQ